MEEAVPCNGSRRRDTLRRHREDPVRRRLAALLHHLRTEHTEPARLGWAVALGLFVGVLPLYGLHLVLCVALALVLGLNKATIVLASQISLPVFAPVLVAGGITLGEWLRYGHHRPVGLADARDFLGGVALLAGALPDRFLSCLLGDALIGVALGALGGVLTWGWARRRTRAAQGG
jgi:uncharacterized protein (DUF2062 family)